MCQTGLVFYEMISLKVEFVLFDLKMCKLFRKENADITVNLVQLAEIVAAETLRRPRSIRRRRSAPIGQTSITWYALYHVTWYSMYHVM